METAADIAAQLKEGVDENAIRAHLFLAGTNMDDINRAFELAKEHDTTLEPSFMEKLKKARKAAELTQKTMAAWMLIPTRTIEDWERGISAPPYYVQRLVLNELRALADARTSEFN